MGTQRLYKSVADDLLRFIASEGFQPGDRLPAERDLAARYNVSRPTIREAVIALEIAGRVSVRKGSGVYVTLPTQKQAGGSLDMDVGPFELTEARLLIEGEAAALAATQINPDELAELEAIIRRMIAENEASVSASNTSGEHADKDFHMLIARATRNSAIAAIIEDLWNLRDKSKLTHTMYETVRQTGVLPSIDEHWAIYNALAAGDSSAARSAMRTHLSRVIDTMFQATEIEAVALAKQKISADRARYSLLLDKS
jgi:DNA-binding FadR family transcriptional regulator